MIHTMEGDFSVSSVNQETAQIVVEGFVFYAGTGKITGHSERGIENLIRLLEAKHGR